MTTPLPHNISWNFPQSESDTKICHKCGEGNPHDAVMCWACYAPLPVARTPANLEVRRKRDAAMRADQRRECWRRRSELLLSFLPAYGVLLLILSGYLAECRTFFVAVALTCFAAHHVRSKHEEAQRTQQLAEQGEPVERIANTIFYYALRDGARTIILRAGVMGVECEYLIGDEWKEQMHIPPTIWEPLRDHLAARSGNWEHPFPFEQEEVKGTITPRLEHLYPHQTIVLRLGSPA